MFIHRITKLAATVITGTAVAMAALATAGVAAADDPGPTQRDNAFVAEVHAAGIGRCGGRRVGMGGGCAAIRAIAGMPCPVDRRNDGK